MSVLILSMVTMHSSQLKTTNFLEFQLKRTQLHGTLLGQFLRDPNNCACLFNGASPFPPAGIATLAGAAPTRIGPFPLGCGVPSPVFIDTTGIDGLRATAIELRNISPTANPNIYSGQFTVNVQSLKEVAGPRDLSIPIPVSITTIPAGANVSFVNCSLTTPASTMSVIGDEGWVRRPDGLLEQWGFISGFPTPQGSRTITFTQAFANTNYSLVLTTVIPGAGDYDNYVQEINGTRSTTGVTLFSQDPSSGGSSTVSGVRWRAIGL